MSQFYSPLERRLVWIALIAIFFASSTLVLGAMNTRSLELPGDGGTFYEGAIGRIMNVNPLYCQTSDLDRDVCQLVFSGLTRFDPETGEVRGDLAYKWDLSQDRKVYTFYLRTNAKFHDGSPVTREDVLFTYQGILQNPDYDGVLKNALLNVTMSPGESPSSIVFTLKQENALFPGTLSIGILPKDVLADVPVAGLAQHAFSRSPIGSGPYRLESIESRTDSDVVKLSRFEDYYDTKPHIQNVIFYGYEGADKLWEAHTSLDGIREVPEEHLEDLAQEGNFAIHQLKMPRYTGLFLNTNHGALKDARVRQAVKSGINIEALIKTLAHAEPVASPLPLITPSHPVTFDQDHAKELLFNAGWKIISQEYNDGIRRSSNKDRLELTLVTTKKPEHVKAANHIKEDLHSIGIEVKVLTLDLGDLQNDYIKTRNYHMLLLGESLRDPLDLYPYYHSSQANDPGLNLSQYQNVKADLLMDQIRTTPDHTEQVSLAKKLVDLLNDDTPAIYLYTVYHTYATNADVKGVVIPDNVTQVSDRFALFREWYMEGNRIWK